MLEYLIRKSTKLGIGLAIVLGLAAVTGYGARPAEAAKKFIHAHAFVTAARAACFALGRSETKQALRSQ